MGYTCLYRTGRRCKPLIKSIGYVTHRQRGEARPEGALPSGRFPEDAVSCRFSASSGIPDSFTLVPRTSTTGSSHSVKKAASNTQYPALATEIGAGPFRLDDGDAYRRWRDRKLRDYPARADELIVEVADPRSLSQAEAAEMLRICRKTNMVVYSSGLGELAEKDIPRQLGAQFGLQHLDPNMLADDDGITSLHVVPGKLRRGYIPYSNRRLLWHTDGYYNTAQQQIRAFILHCVSPAAEGGVNSLMDPELVYIELRDRDPELVRALMQPDAMTIPANEEAGAETRPAQTGPVFSLDPDSGCLHMRYTARTRSIEWKQDPAVDAAREQLEALMEEGAPHVFTCRLESGQGVMSNNVLHKRSGFENDEEAGRSRLIYRARYYDRIAGTELELN
ncbi:MAG: taurine catabolism dioxygenase TauD [Gammaproteobacteria bacterium]|nr:MAG: taurine catabolism dioxygenase TauD [Gammaproteobacteria bacterium]